MHGREDEISAKRAADLLGVDKSRVLALVRENRLAGRKVGNYWVLDRDAVTAYARHRAQSRPLSHRNVWALAALLDGQPVTWTTAPERSRLRHRLLRRGTTDVLRDWLAARARTQRFKIAPGDLGDLLTDDRVVLGGISAAEHYRLGLSAANEAEIYTDAATLTRLIEAYFLVEATDGNLTVHVTDDAWHLHASARHGDRTVAPRAIVAADLLDRGDTRSSSAGTRLLTEALHRARESR